MSTVSGSINLSILAREVLSSGISKGAISREFQAILDLPNGTNDQQINKCYAKRESGIGASVTTVYDLIGSLTDEDGTTINFDEVVLIAIRNLSSTAANYLTAYQAKRDILVTVLHSPSCADVIRHDKL